MLKRFLCCLLCMLLAVVPALSVAEGPTFTMAGYDGEDSTHVWGTNGFFIRMQERTGVSFTFQQYNKRAEWQAAKNAMFAQGGQLPDVLFKAALTTDELIRYTESGQLIDLKPLLEENAPNLWQLLQEHPDWLQAITLPNGKIGALPAIQETGPQDAMWINKDWLEQLKLDMPTDLESLRKVLTAFRDRDPNQNGKKDEIPMLFLGPWELKFFSHAFGVVANDYNVYLDEAGTVHYWPNEDSFVEFLREMRALFADGLLDPGGFTTADALRRVTDDKATNTYGAMFAPTPMNLVTYEMGKSYTLLEPLKYNGTQVYRDLFGQITRGTFAITSACADPAALLRWVDVLYSEEGAIEAMVGVLNENYIMDETGAWDWKGGVDSMNADMVAQLSLYDTGDMPWMFPQAFYNRYMDQSVVSVNHDMEKLAAIVVAPFPHSYTLTQEQNAQAAALQQELGTYVDESIARFVNGEWEINDETIASFREGLVQRGMEDMVAFWQNVAGELK